MRTATALLCLPLLASCVPPPQPYSYAPYGASASPAISGQGGNARVLRTGQAGRSSAMRYEGVVADSTNGMTASADVVALGAGRYRITVDGCGGNPFTVTGTARGGSMAVTKTDSGEVCHFSFSGISTARLTFGSSGVCLPAVGAASCGLGGTFPRTR